MKEILLMLPGPTTADPRVLRIMEKAVINHRGDEFGEIYTETTKLMSKTFQTNNNSYILTGSGTSAMEAALSNLVNRGEKVLNIIGGKFGERFADIAKYHGIESLPLNVEWGTAVTPDQVQESLESDENIKAVTMVHNETSTGVSSPIQEVGEVVKNYDALFIVDTVSSLGGDYVNVDKFHIDACVTGSQKCLAAPPGLAAITFNDDAWDACEKVKSNNYYLNMLKYRESGNKTPAQTPYTPSVSLIYGLKSALEVIHEEGLENSIIRHHKAAAASIDAVKALGLELFPAEEVSSATVTAVNIPEGITDNDIRGTMLNKYKVQLAGGQDHLNGKIIRIGHMGVINYQELAITFTALGLTLKGLGLIDDAGAGVAALANHYI